MDLRQLRQFVALAEERSFRRAAERLHVSQPPLSVALQRLEAEVGTLLVDRSRHHVRLTAAGEAFLAEARAVLARAQLAVDLAQRAAAGKVGTLRLAFVPSAGFAVVPRLLRAFRAGHPDVKIILEAETTLQQTSSMLRDAADVGIVVPPLPEAQAFTVEPLCEEELVLAVPERHPLARRQRVQLRALESESFIGLASKEGPGFESVVISACREAGFLPRFVQDAPQMQTILVLVAAELGVALVPAAMRCMRVAGVEFVEVRRGRAGVRYRLALAFRGANPNPALRALRACAQTLGAARWQQGNS